MNHNSPISDDLALDVEAIHDGEQSAFGDGFPESDPVALAYKEELEDLRSRLRTMPRATAGTELRNRIETGVASTKSGSRRWFFVAAAAAAILLFATVSFLAPSKAPDAGIYVEDLVQRRQASSTSTFATGDRSELQNFLAQKADFLPVIPELEGVTLISGQLCKVDGSPVALIDWKLDSEDLTLYISPTDEDPGDIHQQTLAGYSTCTWRASGLEYVLIGPGDETARLHRLADSARQQHSW